MKPVKETVSKAEDELKSIERKHKEISNKSTTLEADIEGEIEQFKCLLDQLKAKRIGELKKLTREKLRSLNEQKTRAEILRIDFSSCEQAVETKLKIMKDVVKEKDLIITNIQCTMAKHEKDAIQPELGWNIELELDEKEKFQQVCQQLFEITETDIISTENSHILESGLEGATVGTINKLCSF